jgi:ABC-type branched-subunit amino acid transport system ATPase component/ABC-type branched-subunit amino acid transport system permease subunit
MRRLLLISAAIVGGVLLALPLGLPNYWLQLATVVLLYAMAAAGLDLIYGYSGMLSLGHAAFFGIGAYTTALVSQQSALPLILPIALGVLGAMIAGAVVGAIGLRVPAYFPIITLAASLIFFSLVAGATFTGGPSGIAGVSRNLLGTGPLTAQSLYVLVAITLLIIVLGLRSLRKSRTGRALETIRTQERTAQACGVDINGLRLKAFILGAALAGLAGGLFAPVLGFVSPEIVGLTQSVNFLVMVVIGGLGTGWGVILGSLVVRGLPEVAQAVRDWQLIFIGLLTLVVVLRFRRGIAGTLEKAFRPRAATPQTRKAVVAAALAPRRHTADPGQELLELHGIGRRFGGLDALSDVSLDVRAGEIHALVGPNGAGKTTLVNIITGLDQPTSGTVSWAGRDVTQLAPHHRARLGMSRTFQLLGLAPELTLLENTMLGGYLWTSSGLLRGTVGWARKDEEAAVREAAQDVLTRLDLQDIAHLYPSEVAVGQQRLVEVARCLVSRADLLLLDEPAAGLNETETAALGRHLRAIAEEGTAILLVEHDMGLVMDISTRISVIVFGRHVLTGPPEAVANDSRVIESYLGAAPDHTTVQDQV